MTKNINNSISSKLVNRVGHTGANWIGRL